MRRRILIAGALAIAALGISLPAAWAPQAAPPSRAARVAGSQVTIGDAEVIEGDTGFVEMIFPITLLNPVPEDVFFGIATSDGTARADDADYVPAFEEVRIPAGSAMASLTVQVRGDTRPEPDESFTVELLPQLGGPFAATAGVAGTGTIRNDDIATPVLVSGFAARRLSSGIELRWRAAPEAGAVVIERSEDEATWSRPPITWRDRRDETVALDASAAAGRAYLYRLVSPGADELVELARVRVDAAVPGLALRVGPNPSRGPVRIVAEGAGRPFRLDIVDAASRTIAALERGVLPPGTLERAWTPGASVRPGRYWVRLRSGPDTITRPLVIVR